MNRTVRVVAAFAVVLVCAGVYAPRANARKRGADSATTQEAAALFARAKALADMMAPDALPYSLQIRVTGEGQLAAYPEGTYSVQFVSSSEFREDVAFGGAHFSAGANGDSTNQWRLDEGSHDGLLEEVFLRSLAYAYAPTALELSGAKVRVTRRNENGVRLECVEEESPLSKEACFDSSSGALRAVLDDPGFVYQYDDFLSWGKHLAPTKILVFANNALILKASVELLVTLAGPKAQLSNFAPPAGAVTAQPKESCGVQQARLISSAIPSFPRGAGAPDGNGSVLFWGEIDKSGQIEDAIVMHSAGAAYDKAALRAMKQWRYAPTTVCGQPRPTPGTFRIAFR